MLDLKHDSVGLTLKGNWRKQATPGVRVYENALVILPQKGEPIRVPYCYISKIDKLNYRLTVVTDFREKIEFSGLGENFDPLAKSLSEAFNKMIFRSQEMVKEIFPDADPMILRRLARLMKDGLAAKRKDIETKSSDFWTRLLKRVDEAGLSQEYSFLDSIALRDNVCVGVKRGLVGNLTGSYNWMLIPIRNANSGKPENAVALEAFLNSESAPEETENEGLQNNDTEQDTLEKESGSGGRATYFFRIMSRNGYAQALPEELNVELNNFLKVTNRCMVETNFRREIIYLPDKNLESPKYDNYRFAVAKLPAVKTLRSHFIGRVIHSSFDQWKQDVTNILDFNATSKDDLAKWRKGDE